MTPGPNTVLSLPNSPRGYAVRCYGHGVDGASLSFSGGVADPVCVTPTRRPGRPEYLTVSRVSAALLPPPPPPTLSGARTGGEAGGALIEMRAREVQMLQIRGDRPEFPSGKPDPVFVDRTGRRRRLAMLAGVSVGVGLVASLGLIVAGLLAGSPMPIPHWPDGGSQHQPAGGVVADKLGGSPTSGSDRSPMTSTTPVRTTSRTPATLTSVAPPIATSRPGQGTDHRASPGARPSKSIKPR